MAKHYLKLTKEIQRRNLDTLIAHTTIIFMRYTFLVCRCRMEVDRCSVGDPVLRLTWGSRLYLLYAGAVPHSDAGGRSAQKNGQLLRKISGDPSSMRS